MRPFAAVLLLTACVAAAAAAQTSSPVPPVPAFRLTTPITLDGRLDEEAWHRPPAVARLTQRDPVEGAVPRESTWMWVAFDDRALYVAARMWDAHPDSIVAQLVRRDVSTASDRFFVYLDTYGDRRSGYYFGITAAGVLLDGTLFNDNQSDAAWDGVWEGEARLDRGTPGQAGSGWTCELRIPVAQLRSRPGVEQAWGINFKRCISRGNEVDYLVVLSKTLSGFVSRFPTLAGFETPHRGRSVALVPYLTGQAEYLAHDPGDPFHDGSDYMPGAGADLRASIGNNLTLNAAVNPDFGQVEVDPAVVNLTDVESYFEEKRPFFTENARVFSFGKEGAATYWNLNWPNPTFFYSRRIGRAPQGSAPLYADYRDVPVATHILGAAKLTGKPVEGLDLGVLQAVTSREDADLESGGLRSETEVEPLTWYGVVRGLKQFPGRYNGLGALTTLTQRHFGDGGLEPELNRQALMAGLDGWHFLDRRKLWVLSGWAGMTRVAGTRERILALQRSSVHYLQRPDSRELGVDSTATSLTGYGGRVWLNKQEGNVLFNSAVGILSPKFDLNDVGYLSRADISNAHVGLGYHWTEPNGWRKDLSVVGIALAGGNRDGDATTRAGYLNPTLTLLNDWTLNLEYMPLLPVMNDRRTRGGPLTLEPGASWWQVTLDSDPSRRTTWHLGWQGSGAAATGSRYWLISPSVEWKPVSNFTLSAGPSFERNLEDGQYVRKVYDPGFVPADFGDYRYVFARLDQRTVSAEIRLDISFTRNLTLQTYVQPFISAGSYDDFKELERSRSYDFVHYGAAYDAESGVITPADGGAPFAVGEPSFNYKSLRGNAVLRWEYRPGSTLYLVWTQSREDYEMQGQLRFGPSTRRLFDAPASNVFLVKLTYHLST